MDANSRREVVVGLDDSAAGYLAVEEAAKEAAWRGWPLRIIHVRRWREHGDGAAGDASAASDLLADAAEHVRAQHRDVAVCTTVRFGSPAGELITAATGAGLLVVGARGSGGFPDLLTGSVAALVATGAACPVLIVRTPPSMSGGEWLRRPVVVGVDGSRQSYAAFEFAVAEARLRQTDILVVHACRDPVAADPLAAGVLAEVGTSCLGVPVRRRHVPEDPRRALPDLSRRASAVVVGGRGAGGFAGLRAGSVARSLIHHSHSPVFIIHSLDRVD